MCWLFVCFFYRRFYDKDGDIGNLYYKVVSRIRRRNRKVQTPISPLIIFSITLLRTFCNSLFKLFFKFFKVILYCNKICGVPSNLRFSRYSTPPTVHRPGGRAQLLYLYFNKIKAHSQMGVLACCNTDIRLQPFLFPYCYLTDFVFLFAKQH